MDFHDLIERAPAPPNRIRCCPDGIEAKMREGAVMIAFAMHLLRTAGTQHVRIYPDGQHNGFPFSEWLLEHGFEKSVAKPTTRRGSEYLHTNGWRISVNYVPG